MKKPILLNRGDILSHAAQAVLRDREATHGKPQNFFSAIAAQWSCYLSAKLGVEIKLSAADVTLLMVLFKVVRAGNNGKHGDNWIDIAGYAACGGELSDAVVEINAEAVAVPVEKQNRDTSEKERATRINEHALGGQHQLPRNVPPVGVSKGNPPFILNPASK